MKKVFLKFLQNSQENISLAQVFSCEFCEILKNTFFTEHLMAITSSFCKQQQSKYPDVLKVYF